MTLRSLTEYEKHRSMPWFILRHAGIDCRHPGPQDPYGDIHVNLISSS
jgi:hypothetical protein